MTIGVAVMQTFLAGGSVRDLLLGRPGRDRDRVVVGSSPDEMLALGFLQVGRDFPVFLHPETREEHALARDGRGGFGPDVTLGEDLRHRDFTINSLAMDDAGRLYDPVGGITDIEARLIRHVGDSLSVDPLRILRAARFAAQLGFGVAPETLTGMGRLAAAGALATVAPERVWAELVKALQTANPGRFFLVLRAAGVLSSVFPELDRLFGVPQRADYHPEVDTGVHAMMVLDCAARLTADPAVRFAALVHDLGKGTTPADLLPRHHGHEERGPDQVEALVRRYGGPNLFIDLGRAAARLHGLLHKVSELSSGTILEVLTAADAFHRPERLEALLIVGEADRRGRLGHGDDPYPQATEWRRARNAAASITARDLISDGHSPGPDLGPKLFQRRAEAVQAALRVDKRPSRLSVTKSVSLSARMRITDALREIERDDGVTILFAVESGSRAWGFPSPDSDFDVRFVYVRPLDGYLSVSRQRDVIERPIVGDLDINGWDLRKALALLVTGHPVLLEWLCSPIVYLERPETASLRMLAERSDHRKAAVYHYCALLRKYWQESVSGRDAVSLKKYLYCVRPAAALRWLRTNEGRVPMSLPALLAGIPMERDLLSGIQGLVTVKAGSSEMGAGARLPGIDAFVAGELERADAERPSTVQTDTALRAEADRVFRTLARQVPATGA
jgi:tRNA nucleotidyltransferase (CCA-adding enzyme)